MNKKSLQIVIFFLILINFLVMTSAMSPNEATDFVTKTNNFLLSGETPIIQSPQVMIKYQNTNYWVIAGISGNTVTIYLPINNETSQIANGEIEIRELIKTEIILSKIYELKNNYSASDWPFAYPNKTSFETLNSKFNEKIPSYTTIEVGLKDVLGTSEILKKITNAKELLDNLSEKSLELSEYIEEGIAFEKKYYITPDTNQTQDYQKLFENYFELIDDYKTKFNTLKNLVNTTRNEIGAIQNSEITISQKEFYNNIASLPPETALLNTIFSRSDETKTFTEEIFNSTKNIENLVLNLETRKQRNEAWKILYAPDQELIKINSSISSLNTAANTILDEENVNYWKNQDSVEAFKTNWNNALTKYNNGIYASAIQFGKSAQKNAINIIDEGFVQIEDTSQQFLYGLIIGLIVLIISVFLIEKFVLNKKEKKEIDYEEEDDDY